MFDREEKRERDKAIPDHLIYEDNQGNNSSKDMEEMKEIKKIITAISESEIRMGKDLEEIQYISENTDRILESLQNLP